MRRRSLRCLAFIPALLAAHAAQADEGGFVPLFDGKTTAGWTTVGGKPENWLVRDGVLVTRGQGGGWLSTDATYANFVLTLEFRFGPGGNSGVFLRAPREGNPAYAGMEIQILDDDAERYRSLKPYQYTGSIYGVVAAKRGHVKAPGQWNRMEIRADGPKVVVTLNGATIVDANLSEHADAVAEHPGLLRKDGFIGLQSHNDEVEFRNVAIKELK
jgi:hypothetical protein